MAGSAMRGDIKTLDHDSGSDPRKEMESSDEPITAYDPHAFIQAFKQSGAGLDADMPTQAEHTKIEVWHDGKPSLEEYKGSEQLKNKKVIVTGGDSGIGRSVAIFMAREGADVTIVYLPEEEKDAVTTEELIKAAGQKCLRLPGDLTQLDFVESVIEKHMKEYGALDVLVNNASQQIQCKDIKDIDPANVESTLKTNVWSMIVLTKFALKHMKRGASIVNSSSVTAYKGSGGMLDYASTKGAIISFTKSLALQLLPQGITVNAVAPGPVLTPLQPASREADQMKGWGIGDGAIGVRGRVAQPAELGAAYIWCTGKQGSFMTGQAIHVNGGQYFA
ncbi:uncharacterized protein L969DRAFT_90974 [Mixia osmundae IAM 14324]|uniref:Uncharacterized protein n=1 Tax=Mixia osmundae (strain CBS 9802 / IAM 14324 / JCM 22182 / KY 12970) TaxID=764103 RepID=G7DV50_MIXOS|nr:uncharacterized protein L969DRAFT_90974 [Mixia osmundae IAM 14324]KEI36323.1 hypothetical protein L969DRAFT_90974 [Mixia osmundae IAM 14324]GAA94460.1 hypothetical protein E5Q_01112 [Mixia osmundae IAM 14324]